MTEHRFLEILPDDWDNGPHHLEELTRADLICIYNALLLDTISDGERTLGALDLIERILEEIRTTGTPGPTLSG
ncbi:MAG: hypothetical protein KDD28_21420 [Phaeodactylibacter sp.]|nr:hypothetical protein [Phaeodactylibacter sp.]